MSLQDKLLKIAKALGTDEVVEIESAHISGISYRNIGDAGLEYIRDLKSWNRRVRVFTTCNPGALDINLLSEQDPQLEILRLLKRLGVSTVLTCAPYEFLRIKPRRFYAWAESSAAAYIASVCDAYCEKFPGPLALLCAVCGYAPKIGKMKLDERKPRVLVRLRTGRLTYVEAGILGRYLAETFGDAVPYIENAAEVLRGEECLKSFLAAYATYSNNVFVVLERITPRFQYYREVADFEDSTVLEHSDIRKEANNIVLQRDLSSLSKRTLLVLGCPHLSYDAAVRCLKVLSNLDIKCTVFTSRFVKARLRQLCLGNVDVLADMCLFVSYLVNYVVENFEVVLTNSVKQAHYLERVLQGVEVRVVSFNRLEEAISGF